MNIHKCLMRMCGFKPVGIYPFETKKCVIIMAPHTSIVDFFLGLMMIRYLKLKMVMVMKKEFFVFPIKYPLKWMGVVPVDRQHSRHFAEFATDIVKNRDEVALIICPEGTRKLVNRWKKGFYQIAMEANVPIGLSHIDFRTRTLGVGQMFYPTGDYEKDMVEIEKYYHGMRGYRKGRFNLENEPVTSHEWDKD